MCYIKKTKLHISCWNINGYRIKGFNKFENPKFIKEMNTKDIVGLLETHCTPEDNIEIQGFCSVHLSRSKSKKCKKKKALGGISIYVKNQIRSGVKFLTHKTNDFIWLKMCRDFLGTKKDIYLCFIYNPPASSTYTQSLNEEILDILEKDIETHSKSRQIILAGDLNARTGDEQLDLIEQDSINQFTELFNNIDPDLSIPIRYSKDKTISSRGKILNDLCVQTSLRILNGGTTGDHTGQFTCYTYNRCSVVDYFIVSCSVIFHSLKFMI
jgi:exonuclease III